MSKVALIIIYNHQYNKNIDILEKIYKERFSTIYHLVPFYSGKKENVIPVYESSFYFQGYISQGLKTFYNENCEHYFFIADDMILNPIVTENNYREILNLNSNSSYIPRLDSIHKFWKDYNVKVEKAYKFNPNAKGVEVKNILPSYEEALKLLNDHGVEIGKLSLNQISNSGYSRLFAPLLKHFKIYQLPYPLTSSYADICIVSSTAIKDFALYCGIFAALDLWVEVALPTALAFSARDIVKDAQLKIKGRALWSESDYKLLEKYENNLSKLLSSFPKEYLYLHPIKLSKWSTEL